MSTRYVPVLIGRRDHLWYWQRQARHEARQHAHQINAEGPPGTWTWDLTADGHVVGLFRCRRCGSGGAASSEGPTYFSGALFLSLCPARYT